MFQFLKGEKDTALILQIINFIFGIIRSLLGLDTPDSGEEEEESLEQVTRTDRGFSAVCFCLRFCVFKKQKEF